MVLGGTRGGFGLDTFKALGALSATGIGYNLNISFGSWSLTVCRISLWGVVSDQVAKPKPAGTRN